MKLAILQLIATVMMHAPLLGAFVMFSCGDNPSPGGAPGPDYSYRTSGGARVTSPVAVPAEALAQIDRGLNEQIARMPADWMNVRRVADFTDPQAWNQDGSPALVVGGIQTAGTVKGLGGGGDIYILLPHQQAVDWRYGDYLMHSAWNEAEHFSEWFNDKAVFNQYAVANDVHPHRP
jgi:hypothetical protein